MVSLELNTETLDDQSRIEVLVVGKGGEGVASFAEILGLAATLDKRYSSTRSTYGASQRGEAIFSEVIIADIPVQYPFVEAPDHFIALSQHGFYAYYNKIRSDKNPKVFIDSTFEYDLKGIEEKSRVFRFSSLQYGIDHGLNINNANIIMLGSFIQVTKLISLKAVIQALKDKIPKRFIKQNLKALKLGAKLVNPNCDQ